MFATLFSQSATAYMLEEPSYKVASTLVFTPHWEFGSTSIAHFNDAMYEFNKYTGQTLFRREPTLRHDETDESKYNLRNLIYRERYRALSAPGAVRVWRTQPWYNPFVNHVYFAHILIHINNRFVNGAEKGAYDTWTVFVHELGHVAGLDHTNIQNAVMNVKSTGVLNRYLGQDDKNGLKKIYG